MNRSGNKRVTLACARYNRLLPPGYLERYTDTLREGRPLSVVGLFRRKGLAERGSLKKTTRPVIFRRYRAIGPWRMVCECNRRPPAFRRTPYDARLHSP